MRLIDLLETAEKTQDIIVKDDWALGIVFSRKTNCYIWCDKLGKAIEDFNDWTGYKRVILSPKLIQDDDWYLSPPLKFPSKKLIVVYGSTFDKARFKLQELLDNMKFGDIEDIQKSDSNFSFSTKNGDIYKAITANQASCRGYRWQYAYIDVDISNEILETIIFPAYIPKDEYKDIMYKESIQEEYNFLWF